MFLFRSISFLKKSNTFILRKKNEKLSYTRAREIVRSALATLGVNNRTFGLHSFRSGGATAHASSVYQIDFLKSMAVGNQKTKKMDMYVKIYKENYQFLKTSVYNDIPIRIMYTQLSLFISKWSLRQTISV